jgi:hypothetical protein
VTIGSVEDWLCLAAGFWLLGGPILLALILWRVVKWDDRRREKIRSARGFELNDVKSNTGGSPVADTERETNNG